MSGRIATKWRRLDEMPVAQVYDVLRFRQAIFVVEQRSPYPDLDGCDADAWHLLAQTDGGLAGYLRLLARPQAVRIGRVCVAARCRRQGLGRRLVFEALSFAGRHHPGRDIGLAAQVALGAFYHGFGFAPVSAPYDDFGVAHIEMVRRAG